MEIASISSTVANTKNLISQVKEINRTIPPQNKASQIKKKSINQPTAEPKLTAEKRRGRKRKNLDETILSSANISPEIKMESLKRRKTVNKPRIKPKATEILSHIDDLA
ncbi:14298_t:CDS:1, partial [Racocetra fulgida]